MEENFENVENTVEKVETPIEKPIEIRFQEAKTNIYNATNQAIQQYGLPFYVVESIVSDILHQIQAGVKNELDEATAVYQKRVAEQTAGTESTTEMPSDGEAQY